MDTRAFLMSLPRSTLLILAESMLSSMDEGKRAELYYETALLLANELDDVKAFLKNVINRHDLQEEKFLVRMGWLP
jgi:hypothetical protein